MRSWIFPAPAALISIAFSPAFSTAIAEERARLLQLVEPYHENFSMSGMRATPPPSADRLVSRAIARASLVLIPLQGSAVDARQASRAVGLIREEEELIERKIPFRLVFTRTSAAIPTRIDKKIVASLEAASIPALSTHLHERSAYKAMFVDKLALDELDPAAVNGLEAARENAMRLALELVSVATNAKEAA